MLRAALFALLATSARSIRVRDVSPDAETCLRLKNHGSFSTVEVSIGTPPQKFNLVADTGSDSLLVESCACVDAGHCLAGTPCFRGGNGTSKTFHLAHPEHPDLVTITYGSGPLDAVIGSDTVNIGNVHANMQDSLLLVVNNRLDGATQLEGICGLGLPQEGTMQGRGFLDQAHVDRFSMCFNSGQDGVLRLGEDVKMDKPLPGVGTSHWGVEFRGVTVGDVGGEVAFCGEDPTGDQKTSCGALVDSGTTLIMAPAGHVAKLLAQLCDAWPSCQAGDGEVDDSDKAKAFLSEASSCQLDSLPSLHFHVRGEDGTTQALELTARDYMIETEEPHVEVVRKYLDGVIPVDVEVPTSGMEKVCFPAFHTHNYTTPVNGPIWIFGTPFFYKYVVGYDRATTPPSVSFSEGGCNPCGDITGPLLQMHSGRFVARRSSVRRKLVSSPRIPYINASLRGI